MKGLTSAAFALALLMSARVASFAAEPLRVLIYTDSAGAGEGANWVSSLNERHANARLSPGFPTEGELAQSDVLVLYEAKPAVIPGVNRAALEAFAKRGGGFVILHGAVGAGEPVWWKPLIGGAWVESTSQEFKSRMMLYAATDQHPIVAGASPFDIDDDTMYDLDLAESIQVLASAFTPKITGGRTPRRGAGRPGGGEARANIFDLQPQMWAYESPQGGDVKQHRAFVALPGAPETLRHSSFRVFLFRGISWAAGHSEVDEFCSKNELANLRYPAGGPLRAEQTAAQFEVQPGFKVNVAAAEPLIDKPVAVQWDGSGRLWVAETPEYPNGRRAPVAPAWKETGSLFPTLTNRPAHDRISILSDPDENGRFRKKDVFYEGLELVTGFCFYRDGVIAINEPDIVFLRDTDGDGKADKVERLFTGFRPGDTHFVANHFIMAPDGWVYASMGGDAEVKSGDGTRSFGHISSGMFRFKPDGSAIEQFASKGGNSFGAEITSDGEAFFGQATSGNPLQHVVLPEWILARGNVGSPSPKSVIEQRKVVRRQMPSRAALMQIDVVGGYSAACAALIYEGGAWPAEWEGSAFVTEPILNIVHNETVKPAGATFTGVMTRRDAEFIYSPDYWFRPIDCAPGPDGAVYVLDFYSPVIAHSDTRGPQHSRSGASVRPDRDHYFGRIYRVQSEAAIKWEVPDLARAGAVELVKALSHPNRTVRFNAQRLLVEKGGPEVIAAVTPVAEAGSPVPARILALWSLQRLGAMKPEILRAALSDAEPSVRKSAALVVESGGSEKWQRELAALLRDSSPRVRITALRALASGPLNPETAKAVAAIYPALEDNWSRSAALAALSVDPVGGMVAVLESSRAEELGTLGDALARRIAKDANPEGVAALIIRLAAAPAGLDGMKARVLERLANGKTGEASPDLNAALRGLLASANPEISSAAIPLAMAWDKAGVLRTDVDKLIDPLLAALKNTKLPDGRREQAATSLIGLRQVRPEILPAAAGLLLDENNSDELKRYVITALRNSGERSVGATLTESYNHFPAALQLAAFDAIVTRPEWALAFLDAVEKKDILAAGIGPANSYRLRTHPVRAVSERARALLDKLAAPSADKDALIAKLTPLVTQPGNVAKGRELFTAGCAVCHKFGDLGADVGPVLTGMGAHGPEMLLVHILDPNRQVDAGFEAWNVETKDGEFHTGIIAQQNNERIVMRMPGQQIEIPRANIKSRVNTGRSLMPEGFEALGGEALRDIIAFLVGEVSRFRVLDLGTAFTADTRHGLYQSRDADGDTLNFRKFGMASVEGIPFDLVNPANTASGRNIIVLRGGGDGTYSHSLPNRVEVRVGLPARRFYFLGGVAGWGASSAREGEVIMKVSVVYADGTKDTVPLRDGVQFSDYIGEIDVPGSHYAPGLVRGKQIRWFTVAARRKAVVEKLVLESPGIGPAATTAAITADLGEAPLPGPARADAETTLKTEVAAPLVWGAGTRILVVGGGSSHDFKRWFDTADVATLRAMGNVSVNYTESAAVTAKELPNVDVVVSSTNQKGFDTPDLREALMKFADSGKGLVLLHPGVWYNWPWPEYNKTLVGGGARGHDRLQEFEVSIVKEHPVTKGVTAKFMVTDELYLSTADPAGAPMEVLALTSPAPSTKKQHPSVWVVSHPHARIVCIALGHDGRVHDLPEYKMLLCNAVNWVARK